jgi:hypothetical protein
MVSGIALPALSPLILLFVSHSIAGIHRAKTLFFSLSYASYFFRQMEIKKLK